MRKRSYARALSNEEMEDNQKMRRSYQRKERIERSGAYVERDEKRIAMNKMGRTMHVGVCRSSTAKYSLGLVDIIQVSNMKVFLTPLRVVAVEMGINVPDTAVLLAFVIFGSFIRDIFRLYDMFICKRMHQRSSRIYMKSSQNICETHVWILC